MRQRNKIVANRYAGRGHRRLKTAFRAVAMLLMLALLVPLLGYRTKAEYTEEIDWKRSGSYGSYQSLLDDPEYNGYIIYPFAPDDGWTYVDADGDGVNWKYWANQSGSYKDSYSWDEDPDYYNNGGEYFFSLYPDNWMITPGYRIDTMKYNLKFQASSGEPFSVYCGLTNDISKMKKLKEIPAGDLREYSIPLNGYEGKKIYVAFRHYNPKGGELWTAPVKVSKVRIVYEFADVRGNYDPSKDPYYYDPVYWAAEEGITGGVKDADGIARKFDPQGVCNRGQMVSFLWRMAGCPEPAKYTSYSDVKKTDYYYKAVSWAQEKGITGGYGDGTFRPKNPCSRAQAVSFLYRMADQPKVSGDSSFSDVKPGVYYYNAVIWASQNGITGGYSDDTFKPDGQCTRAQMVTFLYRYAHMS